MTQKFQQGKRRKMTKFVINELASVDYPAQEGARALLLKRRHPTKKKVKKDEEVAKNGDGLIMLTSSEAGHAHGIRLFPGDQGGSSWYAWNPELEDEHNHAFVIEGDGTITVALNAGHGHTVERPSILQAFMALSTRMREDEGIIAMARKCHFRFTKDGDIIDIIKSGDPGEESNMTEEEAKVLKAKLDRAEKVATLTDAQKAHFAKLDEEAEQTAFLDLAPADRQKIIDAQIDKAKVDDPVVYTDTDGNDYFKSDDARVVSAVKRADDATKRLIASESVNKQADFEKRAEDNLPNLPGTIKVRAEIVKQLDGIKDEAIKSLAIQSVIAGDRAMKAAFNAIGHGDGQMVPMGVNGGDGVAKAASVNQLDVLAKARMVVDKSNYEDAYMKVCDENPVLAEQAIVG